MATTENKDTEQKIIEAARQVFLEKGFSEASMSDIAQRVGINRPALHYYYRTKEKMMKAVYLDIAKSFVPKVIQILQNSDIPLYERMVKVVDVYYDILIKEPNLPMFGLREIHRDAHYLFETIYEMASDQIIAVREIILSEMEKGRIRKMPIEFIVYSFYGLLFAPFTFHPMSKLVTDIPDPLTKEYLENWKKQIASQMKGLLAVE